MKHSALLQGGQYSALSRVFHEARGCTRLTHTTKREGQNITNTKSGSEVYIKERDTSWLSNLLVVTRNTTRGCAACSLGIPWVAGKVVELVVYSAKSSLMYTCICMHDTVFSGQMLLITEVRMNGF